MKKNRGWTDPVPGKASPELRSLLGETRATLLDVGIRQAYVLDRRRFSPALVRALQGVRDGLFDMDALDKRFMEDQLVPFIIALGKFTDVVAEEADPKHPGQGLRPRRVISHVERTVRWMIVSMIDSGLKGKTAVEAYRLAVRDYLGREIESESNDFAGDARREMRRVRKVARDGILPPL